MLNHMSAIWKAVPLALALVFGHALAQTAEAAQSGAEHRATDPQRLAAVKALCREYAAGFVSPATDLAYGKRINGPRGIAVLESPKEIALGRVNGQPKPMGYGAGIEDTAYHNGLLLYALCDAGEATGDPFFTEMARRAFRGLRRIAAVTPHPGFVPRGPHPDGKSYYRDSSLDQHSLFVCGLWRYQRSSLASSEDRTQAREMIHRVVARLEKNNWAILVEDNSAPSWEGGSLLAADQKWSLLLLVLVAAAKDATGDPHWAEVYDRFSRENSGQRWSALARPLDLTRPRRYTMFQNQHIVRGETLRAIETDSARRELLRRRTSDTATDMLSCAYFQAWRPLEWFREAALDDPAKKAAANRQVAPLGVTVDSPITALGLFEKFQAGGGRGLLDAITLSTPAMVCQIALLSERPELARQVEPVIDRMIAKIDYANVNSGWALNYAVLAGLWSLAHSQR